MAINIKNYVDISTTFPSANFAVRSFGGLVFTATDAIEQSSEDMQEAYEAYMGGGVTYLSLEEVALLFGITSDEYKFAEGYYGYISPSGRFASRIAYSKVLSNETPLEAFTRINKITNLFGSFTFLSVQGGGGSSSTSENSSGMEELKAVAQFNASLDSKYLFVVNSVVGEMSTEAIISESKQFKDIKGTVFVAGKTDVSGYMPMAILGSTDYANGQVVNYMFKQFSTEEPAIEDDKTYTAFNKAYVNFYGRTQTNGQTMDFFQRGFNTDGTDTAVYCNEMWFKSLCETALIELLVTRERLPADALGVDLVKLEVVDCCADAIRNGMFMQKELSSRDVRGVREIVVLTGGNDSDVGSIEADVSTKGYSVYAYLTSAEDDQKLGTASEKVIMYYVFYGTADSVRYIKGNDILLK